MRVGHWIAAVLATSSAALSVGCLGSGTQRIDATCREMRSAVAYEMLADNPSVIVLDVRAPGEVATGPGRLPRARQIPLDELSRRLPELESYKQRTVVVAGIDGVSGRCACTLLSQMGFEYVIFLSDGIEGWYRDRLPPVADPTPTPGI